jgi:hypothetical protein
MAVQKVVVADMPPQEDGPIKYGVMGSEDIPVDESIDEFVIGNARIGEIKGLDGCEHFTVHYWPKNLKFRD